MSPPADLVPFVADSVEDAVTQVRTRLGPTAVVVHVRRIPVQGKGWFRRRKQRLEILAHLPDTSSASLDSTSDAPALPSSPYLDPDAAPFDPGASGTESSSAALEIRSGGGAWRIGALLEG